MAFTLDDLVRVMREAAGEDESIDLGGDIAQTDFADLGYDSLALMETASRIEREFGVTLPEELVSTIENPQQFVDVVDGRLAASA